MSLFKGMADDLPLMNWLKDYIWPVEKKYIGYDCVYLGILLSIAPSIRCETSCLDETYTPAEICNFIYFHVYRTYRDYLLEFTKDFINKLRKI